jgi:hypothetical protein
MMANVERLHDQVEVEGDLRLALEIVERLEPPDDLRLAVFQSAAQLLTQSAAQLLTHRLINPTFGGLALPS